MTTDSQYIYAIHDQGGLNQTPSHPSHRPFPPQTQRIPLRLHPLPPCARLILDIIAKITHTTASRSPTTIYVLARGAHLPPRCTCVTFDGFAQSLCIAICGLVGSLARVAHAATEPVDAGSC